MNSMRQEIITHDASLDYAFVRGTIVDRVGEPNSVISSQGGLDYRSSAESTFTEEVVVFRAYCITTSEGGFDY